MDFRTDLAVERRDLYNKANSLEKDVDGIECEQEQLGDKISVTRVKITNENGEKAIQKPKGEYITLDIKKIKYMEEETINECANVLSKEIVKLVDMHIEKQEPILIVGLGNIYATPDALGPKVANEIEVTRHVIKYCPQFVKEGTRSISAISPGVLGITGIETLEIVKGIIDNIKPKLVIAIDSLCSRNIDRISSTIQISDTGIVPGAGVGNTRAELSQNTLGIPVVAIGVPTVVDLGTIIDEGLDIFITNLQDKAESNEALNKLKEEDNYEKIKESLAPKDYNMIVTPKEIDDLIENMKDVIAKRNKLRSIKMLIKQIIYC